MHLFTFEICVGLYAVKQKTLNALMHFPIAVRLNLLQ